MPKTPAAATIRALLWPVVAIGDSDMVALWTPFRPHNPRDVLKAGGLKAQQTSEKPPRLAASFHFRPRIIDPAPASRRPPMRVFPVGVEHAPTDCRPPFQITAGATITGHLQTMVRRPMRFMRWCPGPKPSHELALVFCPDQSFRGFFYHLRVGRRGFRGHIRKKNLRKSPEGRQTP